MARHRFFVEGRVQPEPGPLRLTASDAHHLIHVLRLGPGDTIVCVDSRGLASEVRITRVSDGVIEGERVGDVGASRLPRVWLVQGLAKGEKMDTIVRQATELGVERIVPLASSRAVVRLDGTRAQAKRERWQRIAREAAKQAQRVTVPEIAEVTSVKELDERLCGAALILVAWEDAAGAPGIGVAVQEAVLSEEDVVVVVVGPEGGLSTEEVASLVSSGARMVSLGPTVLRTETAGVVATALALAARGGLAGE